MGSSESVFAISLEYPKSSIKIAIGIFSDSANARLHPPGRITVKVMQIAAKHRRSPRKRLHLFNMAFSDPSAQLSDFFQGPLQLFIFVPFFPEFAFHLDIRFETDLVDHLS